MTAKRACQELHWSEKYNSDTGHGLAQIGPDGRLQYEYMLKDNQTYTELVVIDPNESCAPISCASEARTGCIDTACSANWLLQSCKFAASGSELATSSKRLRGGCATACLMTRGNCSDHLSMLRRASHCSISPKG